MSTERAWPFPASRALAAWWQQLSRWQPGSMWIGHLPIHHVEALVEVRRSCSLDPFDRLVLQSVPASSPASLDDMAARLLLGRQLLFQVLQRLETVALVQVSGAGWMQTSTSPQAIALGHYPAVFRERRALTFLHHDQQPAHFLRISEGVTVPCPPPPNWSFDPAVLHSCIAQPESWKCQVGFPVDIIAVASMTAGPEAVVIDRPEKLAAALIVNNRNRLFGFEVKEDGWILQADRPLFELEEWRACWPELLAQDWAAAWQEWCRSRKLTFGEAVELRPVGHVLHVGGRQLREQFGKRGDVLKGEAWLLAGSGRYRRAMLLEVSSI